MDKKEFLNYVNTSYADKPIPSYVEIEDVSANQIKSNGEFTNDVGKWGIFEKNTKWYFVQTDNERGYIDVVKEFSSQTQAVLYVQNLFEKKVKLQDENSQIDRAIRFIQDKSQCSEKSATLFLKQIENHEEIFDEFLNYIRIGKFRKKDKTKVNVHGYTAEKLHNEYGLSPLDAYNYLVRLIEKPNDALENLKKVK